MAELHRHGVTVPKVIAAHPKRQAVLLERVGGETWFRLIKDPDEQVRTARDFIAKLAALHRIDAADLTIPSLGPLVRSPGTSVTRSPRCAAVSPPTRNPLRC